MRKWMMMTGLALMSAVGSGVQAADLILNVTLDYDQGRNHAKVQAVFNDLARTLTRELGQPVRLIMTQNAERVGERVRTGSFAIMLAPAQLVGLAMRYGFTPVARTEADTRVVLLAQRGTRVNSIDTARGLRVALPHRESLVSHMLRGEMNAQGLSPARHFGQITHMNQYGAVLYAMDIGQADLAAVKTEQAEAWIARNPGARVAASLPPVPAAGVVVHQRLDADLQRRIGAAFAGLDANLERRLAQVDFGPFRTAQAADFKQVSERGHFTPEVPPPGVRIVTAQQVKQLVERGVALFDVRPQAHFRQAHIPGARNVTYHMNSPKEIDFDDSVDRFDLSRLPKDKNTPMIFQCNGAECWYSYKAARYMARRGYTQVHWFRTGLPAWQAAGFAVQRGS